MRVQDVMQTKIVTAAPETTLAEALGLTRPRDIRHLPVLAGHRLVGIVSDRDLRRAWPPPAPGLEVHDPGALLDRLRLEQIMTRPVITTGPQVPIEDAADLMVRERIGALPVIEGDRLVGLVTETDVLRLFVQALGAGEPSTRLEVVLGNRPHALAEVVQAVDAAGVEISSLVTLTGPGGLQEAVVRIRSLNPAPAAWTLQVRGFAARGNW